ncbi:hypothetical protein D3C71_2069980 [compost metagenome]
MKLVSIPICAIFDSSAADSKTTFSGLDWVKAVLGAAVALPAGCEVAQPASHGNTATMAAASVMFCAKFFMRVSR